jgi:hypothetical protein
MNNKHTALRGLLWFICVYHVVLGLCANLPPSQVQAIAAALLGLQLPDNAALFQLLKPFGVYVMVFGVAMGIAAWNPVKNRALISLGVVLFALRLIQRLVDLDGVQQNLGVTSDRNWATIATVAVFTLLLAVLRWKLHREMHHNTAAASST